MKTQISKIIYKNPDIVAMKIQIYMGARAGWYVRVRNIPFFTVLLLTLTYLTFTLNFMPNPRQRDCLRSLVEG